VSTPLVILVTAVCLLASGFYSGAETGFMSVSRIRLSYLRRRREPGWARELSQLVRRVEDPILTCLIGTNLFNVLGSAVVTAVLSARHGPRGEVAAAVIMSVLVIVFGEIVPKIIFREYPEGLMPRASRLVRWTMLPLAPVRWGLLAYSRLLHRLLPGESGRREERLDRAGLVSLLQSHPSARQDRHFNELLDRCLELAGLRLAAIMTPLTRMVTLPADATLDESRELAASSGFSRLPVRAAAGEGLAGWVLARDLLLAVDPSAGGGGTIPGPLLRTCLFVDEDMSPWALFDEMRWQRQQMSIVVDREGTPRGMVTLEDLLEVIVGRIEDEHDFSSAPAAGELDPAPGISY